MPSDTYISQRTELKLLLPILKDALSGSEGHVNLNLIGPISVYSAPPNEAPVERELLRPVENGGTDDLFDCEVTLEEFTRRARARYFRLICMRCNFDRDKVMKVIDIGSPRIYQLAKQYGVKFASTKLGPGRLLTEGGKTK